MTEIEWKLIAFGAVMVALLAAIECWRLGRSKARCTRRLGEIRQERDQLLVKLDQSNRRMWLAEGAVLRMSATKVLDFKRREG
jgi:hypothetical protein